MDSSGLVDSIWVTDYRHATTLAAGLREAVITAWRHKLANAGRDDTAAKVYDYIATGGFADRYSAAERALDAQLETLRKEKRYYAPVLGPARAADREDPGEPDRDGRRPYPDRRRAAVHGAG